jgi:hypothetical protein
VTGPYGSVSSMSITTTATAGQSLTIDYATGDPLPDSGVTYDPTAATGLAINLLNLEGGLFTSETYAPTGAGAGTITYSNSTHTAVPISFSNLSPVDDTFSSPTFTFDAPAASTTVNIGIGPIVDATQTDQINDGGTGTFELINFGNKTAVTANVDNSGATTTVETTTAAAGLSTLLVNSGAGSDTIDVKSTPSSVTTTTDMGSGTGSTTNIGDAGVLTHILGAVNVQSTGGSNTLNLDDAAEATAETYTIGGDSTTGTVTGTSFTGPINFTSGITTLGLFSAGDRDKVDFTGPVLGDVSTDNFNADSGPGPNTLNITSSVAHLTYTSSGVLGFGTGAPVINYTNF